MLHAVLVFVQVGGQLVWDVKLASEVTKTSAVSRLKFNPQWRVGSKLEEA